MQTRGWALWDSLHNALQDGGMLDEYDIIILDTPPALGYLTINALAAADILLSGYRRLVAVRQLFEATGDAKWSTIEAIVRAPEALGGPFVAMVEENEIRA